MINENYAIYDIIGYVVSRLKSDVYIDYSGSDKSAVCLKNKKGSPVIFIPNIEDSYIGTSVKIYWKILNLEAAVDDHSDSFTHEDFLDLFKKLGSRCYTLTNDYDDIDRHIRDNDIVIISNFEFKTEDDILNFIADVEHERIPSKYKYLYDCNRDKLVDCYEQIANGGIGCSVEFKKLQRLDEVLSFKNNKLKDITAEIERFTNERNEALTHLSEAERLFYETTKE